MKSDNLLRQQLFPFEFDLLQTFENFFVSDGNKSAFLAAQKVCEEEGGIVKNLFFHGETGCGKTHLLQAIGNAISTKYPSKVIKLIPLARIREKLADSSSGEDAVVDIILKYEDSHVLLVDDVEEAALYPVLQEAMFHLFNHFKENQRLFVATGKNSPAETTSIAPRLASRLAWGLAVKIGPPDEEARRNVLKRLAEEKKLVLEEREINYILNHYPRDFPSLRRIVEEINRYSLLTRRKATIPLIQEACGSLEK